MGKGHQVPTAVIFTVCTPKESNAFLGCTHVRAFHDVITLTPKEKSNLLLILSKLAALEMNFPTVITL